MTVTAAQIKEYQENGAICLRGIFSHEELNAVCRGIEYNRAYPSPYGETLRCKNSPGAFFDDYCNWHTIPEFHDYIYNSAAAEIAGRLMQSATALIYHEHVLVKDPGALKQTPWHHDQPYYPISGRQICSIWMPVDPVPLEASLQFVKGSHNWNRWFIPRKFATEKNYRMHDTSNDDGIQWENIPDIEKHPEDYEVISWDLEPGDCVVFHGATLHAADGNLCLSQARRVLSTRWLGDDARFTSRPWKISPPITGGLKPGDAMRCPVFPLVWEEARELAEV